MQAVQTQRQKQIRLLIIRYTNWDKTKKTMGLTPIQAQTLADEIYKVNANVTSGTETFMNLKEHKTQITRDERASQLWGQTLKETFLDGFNGVK